MALESDLTVTKHPIVEPDERFMDFKIGFKGTGPGVTLYAKWPAMEQFVISQMEKDYGASLAGAVGPCKSIKGAQMYIWSGRVQPCPAWGGPPISYREKDPLWSGDGTYLNVWWFFVVGLKDGIKWSMRFPPDAEHMEGYAKHINAYAREFGERIMRPYEISLSMNLKVVK